MKNLFRPLIVIFAVLTAVTGLAYPAVMTAVGQAAFHDQVNGSLIEQDGKVVGSKLIGQQFDAPQYFWGRLSATSPMPYNPTNSGGSNLGPTKLIEIVEIGKQMLMTRGSLTTFSIANDVAKYFAIIPAAFATTYPALNALNVMHLATPTSAIMSAVIFNALIIVLLIPLALKGVRYRALGAAILLRRNLLIYGLGGIIVPFIGIKLIDMVLAAFGWV